MQRQAMQGNGDEHAQTHRATDVQDGTTDRQRMPEDERQDGISQCSQGVKYNAGRHPCSVKRNSPHA